MNRVSKIQMMLVAGMVVLFSVTTEQNHSSSRGDVYEVSSHLLEGNFNTASAPAAQFRIDTDFEVDIDESDRDSDSC